jgi:DNA topoisomerase-1
VKKSAAKPKSEAVNKARAPVTAKTSPSKATKPVVKKSAGKASG